jgi:hypothetical protein
MRFNGLNMFTREQNPDPYSVNPYLQRWKKTRRFGMFFPDLVFFHPGSRVRKAPEPGFGSPPQQLTDKAF